MGFEIINKIKKEKGLTNAQVAKLAGITLSTLDKITSGANQNPKLDTLQALCRVLGCTLDDFSDDPPSKNLSSKEREHIKKYRALDEHGKKAIDSLLKVEHERCMEPKPVIKEVIRIFRMRELDQAVSAGTGLYTDENTFTERNLIKEPPYGATHLLRVSGDSMEPTFYDGDLLFVRAQQTLDIGEIGIFVRDGDLFVKELGYRELISHNPDYDPIPLHEYERVECQGKVLGVCTDDYFE